MIFEVGKYYKHSGSGILMHIVGAVDTDIYGTCLVGECTHNDNLIPIGRTEEHAINHVEISKEEWDSYLKR